MGTYIVPIHRHIIIIYCIILQEDKKLPERWTTHDVILFEYVTRHVTLKYVTSCDTYVCDVIKH